MGKKENAGQGKHESISPWQNEWVTLKMKTTHVAYLPNTVEIWYLQDWKNPQEFQRDFWLGSFCLFGAFLFNSFSLSQL